ncbi:hypothetical protein SEA_SOOS_49 [Gordonia phage Soos]|nr:hypothetical protein SEA_SOOS_49 [Gordonia phage Soos]
MARVTGSYQVNQGQIRQIVVGPSGVGTLAVQRLVRATANAAKIKAPVRTGVLRNSITYPTTPRTTGMKVESEVVATAPYAAFVHDGTRPHVIKPRNASVLRFPAGGGIVYAAHVNHPGTRARPFLRNALNQEAPRLGFTIR